MQQVANISQNLPSVPIRFYQLDLQVACLAKIARMEQREGLLRPLAALVTTYQRYPSHATTHSRHLQDIQSK